MKKNSACPKDQHKHFVYLNFVIPNYCLKFRHFLTIKLQAVNGINSTGLREESYDVIISAGGFAPGGINPNDINEVIRILKEEGVLLWTQHNYYKDTGGLSSISQLLVTKSGFIRCVSLFDSPAFLKLWILGDGKGNRSLAKIS